MMVHTSDDRCNGTLIPNQVSTSGSCAAQYEACCGAWVETRAGHAPIFADAHRCASDAHQCA